MVVLARVQYILTVEEHDVRECMYGGVDNLAYIHVCPGPYTTKPICQSAGSGWQVKMAFNIGSPYSKFFFL